MLVLVVQRFYNPLAKNLASASHDPKDLTFNYAPASYANTMLEIVTVGDLFNTPENILRLISAVVAEKQQSLLSLK